MSSIQVNFKRDVKNQALFTIGQSISGIAQTAKDFINFHKLILNFRYNHTEYERKYYLQ